MDDLFAKCGANCGRCPSYRENLVTDKDRRRCSEGWRTYVGANFKPEKLLTCEGCQEPYREDIVRYYKRGCIVSKCAEYNGVETCANCSAYPCDELRNIYGFMEGDARAKVEAKFGKPIPDEDYLTVIEPYEGIKHLDEIRTSLEPEDIVEMKPVSTKANVAPFPDELNVPAKEARALKVVYDVISSLKTVEDVSYAFSLALKDRSRRIMKILWAFARLGEPENGGGLSVKLSSETYIGEKLQSDLTKVEGYAEALAERGVRCEVVPLLEKGWRTDRGSLRKTGWYIKMGFDETAGRGAALDALQTYAVKLIKAYGKNAFLYFAKADMRVFKAGD
ncbi:MAG: DUF3795 domain-containing protein [Candidatus Coatesbacteria bacterium]|nr:MAG: DUF3795 domain-containing protein [Candidatus Coatesbacteria bacterium]